MNNLSVRHPHHSFFGPCMFKFQMRYIYVILAQNLVNCPNLGSLQIKAIKLKIDPFKLYFRNVWNQRGRSEQKTKMGKDRGRVFQAENNVFIIRLGWVQILVVLFPTRTCSLVVAKEGGQKAGRRVKAIYHLQV